MDYALTVPYTKYYRRPQGAECVGSTRPLAVTGIYQDLHR